MAKKPIMVFEGFPQKFKLEINHDPELRKVTKEFLLTHSSMSIASIEAVFRNHVLFLYYPAPRNYSNLISYNISPKNYESVSREKFMKILQTKKVPLQPKCQKEVTINSFIFNL